MVSSVLTIIGAHKWLIETLAYVDTAADAPSFMDLVIDRALNYFGRFDSSQILNGLNQA